LDVGCLPEGAGQAGAGYANAAHTGGIVKSYKDGGARLRYPFAVSRVNEDSPDAPQGIADAGFMESLSEWMRKQTHLRNLPLLPEGLTPRSIRATGSGYLSRPLDTGAGKYQIYCELEYYRKGEEE
jgi:hypothetical protein